MCRLFAPCDIYLRYNICKHHWFYLFNQSIAYQITCICGPWYQWYVWHGLIFTGWCDMFKFFQWDAFTNSFNHHFWSSVHIRSSFHDNILIQDIWCCMMLWKYNAIVIGIPSFRYAEIGLNGSFLLSTYVCLYPSERVHFQENTTAVIHPVFF